MATMNVTVPATIRRLRWSMGQRPECPVRGCELHAEYVIGIPTVRRDRPSLREVFRCRVHGREWAERHDLVFPPAEVA